MRQALRLGCRYGSHGVLTMHARAQRRMIFAGVGVSGSLVAAVAAVFALAGGILSFNSWPVARPAAPEASLNVAAPVRSAAAKPLALATPVRTARAARPTVRPQRSAPSRARVTSPKPATPATPPAAPGGATPTAPAAAPATATPTAASPSASPTPLNPVRSSLGSVAAPVAGAVAGTTGATAQTVDDLGAAVPPLAPVTSTLGAGVAGTGQAAAGLLGALGAPR